MSGAAPESERERVVCAKGRVATPPPSPPTPPPPTPPFSPVSPPTPAAVPLPHLPMHFVIANQIPNQSCSKRSLFKYYTVYNTTMKQGPPTTQVAHHDNIIAMV